MTPHRTELRARRFARRSSMPPSSTSGGAQDETWRVAELAREFPSVPFFGLTPLRAHRGPALAQCARCEFADVARRRRRRRARCATSFCRSTLLDALRPTRSRSRRRRSARRADAVRGLALHGGARRAAPVRTNALAEAHRCHARAPEPNVRRRGRAESQARHRSRPPDRRGRAGEESRATTCATWRESSASRRRRTSRARRSASSAPARVAHAAARHRSRRAFSQGRYRSRS